MGKPWVAAYVDLTQFDDSIEQLLKDSEKLVVNMLNGSARMARKSSTKRIADEFRIKPQSVIGRRMKITTAKKGKLVAVLRLLAKPVSAFRLAGVHQVPRGVTSSTLGWPGAFIARSKFGDHKIVYRRQEGSFPKKVERPNWKGTRKPRSFRQGYTKRNTHWTEQPIRSVTIEIKDRARIIMEVEAERAAERYAENLAAGIASLARPKIEHPTWGKTNG